VRVAVVGLGWVARAVWLPRLAADSTYDVVAAVDPALAGTTVDFRGAPVDVVADVAALPPGCADVAFVLSPNDTHADVAGRLLAAGVPVFLEKPACRDRAELERLVAAGAVTGAPLVASAAVRYRADVGVLAGLVAAGALGAVREVDVSWVRARGVPGTGTWFTSRARAGGGAFLDLGWHLLEVARLLAGERAVRRATAVASADFVARPEAASTWKPPNTARVAPPDVEDTMRAYAVLDDGTGLLVHAAWASHEPVDRTVVAVTGTDARAVLTTTFGFSPRRVERPSCVLFGPDGPCEVPLPPSAVGDEYGAQLADLPAVLAAEGTSERTVAEAGWILDVVAACYASADAATG
jgi:oxidoreductase